MLNNPSMAEPLGLNPLKQPPSDERFSEFLRSNPNGYFQAVRKLLVQELINEGVVHGTGIGFDSCPIEASVKENNLKTSIKDRYDKYRLVSGDKNARLGVNIHFPSPSKKKIDYFWDYLNFIINDLEPFHRPIIYPAGLSPTFPKTPVLPLSNFPLQISCQRNHPAFRTI